MPLKLNVGLMKKIGQPRYGSLAASCHLEIELESSFLDGDPSALQDRARRTFAACRRAVETELAIGDLRKAERLPRMRETAARLAGNEPPAGGEAQSVAAENSAASNGAATNGGGKHESAPGDHIGSSDEASWLPASASQLGYVRRLASQTGRAAALRVVVLAQRSFGKPLAELSRDEASRLILTLRAVKAGQLDWEQLLEESAA